MPAKQTIPSIQRAKGQRKLAMITVYDALFAALFNQKVDMLLVGDSLNMSFLGASDTLSATLEQMIYHTRAVCNGAPGTFVICDMPFGTYGDAQSALQNAVTVLRSTAADAVKLEGGVEKAPIVRHLRDNAIPVLGHVGLLPQSVRAEGGYRIKGKNAQSTEKVLADAKAVEEAGAFALVLEGVVPETAAIVTQNVAIPVIGIGAGAATDGQVLVWSDMLGFFEAFTPKFVKHYLNGAELVKEAVARYAKEVETGEFPAPEHCY